MWFLKIGDVFDRRYRILRRIGSGGMSYVFAAEDQELAETVALKIIKPDFVEDEEFVTRFKREVRIARQIRHPNVVQVFEFGHTSTETTHLYYLTMELLKGRDLGAWLRAQKPAAPAAVLRIGIQLCEALDVAHKAGVIHRDIKPQNIFIEPDEQVKLMDFGISRVTNLTSVTQGGKLIGTPRYMAPEQIHGQTTPDRRCDLYAVGVVLYELCTRRKPFDGENTIEIAMKQLQERPQRPRELNPRVLLALDSVIMRCLEKDPNHRFQSAAELRSALDTILTQPKAAESATTVVGVAPPVSETQKADLPPTRTAPLPVGEPTKPQPSGSVRTVRKAPPPHKKPPFVTAALALAALVVVGALGIGVYRWLTPSTVDPTQDVPEELEGAALEQPTTEPTDAPEQPPDEVETAALTTVPVTAEKRPPTTSTVPRKPPATSTIETTPPKPAVPMGELRVTSNPTGAAVTIDGDNVGTTPWQGELSQGEHRLRVSHPGYSPVEQRVSIPGGELSEQSLRLIPRQTNVTVKISANPGTEIYVDGKLAGKIPPVVQLDLPSGRHRLRYVLPDYDEHQETVDVLPNQPNTFSHRFPLYGSLRILATPYAQVHLDGKDLGFTPVNINKVTEGTHELTLTREGFETIRETITVKPGEVNIFQYTLVTKNP
jgi:serine/threonine protein kinase